ncbi:MAG: hypothetical protein CL908_23790 [Deltaproteobacteria bacterium]|nr:hypothetical protein [Deltaproteobacteria bacterium]
MSMTETLNSQPTPPHPQLLVPNGTLGMAIFIAAEATFFAGLISAYLVLRAGAFGWPPPDQPRLPVLVTGINTLVLLTSGWTMWQTLLARGGADLRRSLLRTAMLGAVFLGVQGFEWVRLISFGLTTTSSLFGATFYVLVGAHGVHVMAALAAVFYGQRRVRIGGEADLGCVQPIRMYWLFVVAVWPVLYAVVYF